MLSYITAGLAILFTCLYFKVTRYYICSYFFSYLYDRPKLSKFLGINYVNDTEFVTTKTSTKIYLSGVFIRLFSWFTGMETVTSQETKKELLRLQGLYANNIDMKYYFGDFIGKTMTITEFEDKLSECILDETIEAFELCFQDETSVDNIKKHLKLIRSVLSGLTGGEGKSIKTIVSGLSSLRKIKNILETQTYANRLILLVPHLSLIEGFSKMIINTHGDMSNLQMKDFFDYTSRFFVVVHEGTLTFVNRTPDDKNTENNRAFGISPGFICPGSRYVAKFITSILNELRQMKITIDGIPNISNNRFRVITNKDDVKLTFGTV